MKTGIMTVILLLWLCVPVLCACNQEIKEVAIAFKGVYSLVRSDYQDKAPVTEFIAFGKTLKELGAEVDIKTDYLAKKKNEQPGEYELLFGYTERTETAEALAEHEIGYREFLIELVGNKIVVLAGSNYAYGVAADWLLARYDAETGMLSVPERPYIGTWIPALEDLTIDGIPIEAFRIVADDIQGWELSDAANTLNTKFGELCATELEIVSDESEAAEHEIILCSAFANRTLPEQKGVFLDDGNLYLYAQTKAEFDALFTRFCDNLLCENASDAITSDTLSVCKQNDAGQERIAVDGDSPLARGENLRAAFEKAGALHRASFDAPMEVTITLADGEYLITEPIVIRDTEFSRLTVCAADGATPVITGAVGIPDSAWEKVDGTDYYRATLDSEKKVRDLFVNEKNIPIAYGSEFTTVADFDNPDDRSDDANLKGIYLHADAVAEIEDFTTPTEFMLYHQWEFYRVQIIGVDRDDTKVIDGQNLVRVKFNEKQMADFAKILSPILPLPGRDYCFMNNVSLLSPGFCVCDYSTNTVYYYPENGAPEGVSYSVLDQLIAFENAENISFEGIRFTGTACTSTAENGYFTGQANCEARYGALECAALLFENCTNVCIDDCAFVGIGTNGVQTVGQQEGIRIENCIFDDVSMSAIRLGNNTDKWQAGDANYDITIKNNRIEHIGMEYPSATAIYISHVDGAEISHNTIHDTSYTGISCGWGWNLEVNDQPYGAKINLRHVEIAYNCITDVMRLLHDGGPIYVLGPNCTTDYTELFNEMHHNYSAYEPTDDRFKTGYYLDGSSSNWHVYDNVTLGPVYPLYTQYNVIDQHTHNVLSERIYATEEISMQNHAPERNVIFKREDALVADTPDALYAQYPEAMTIFEESGCRIDAEIP